MPPVTVNTAVHLHELLNDPETHFKLVDGQLATEGKFFHAIRNFFSTRNAIQARNQQLHAKMADILKRDKMPNLAESFLGQVGAYRESGKHLMSEAIRRSLAQGIKEAFVQLDASAAASGADLSGGQRDAAARLAILRVKVRDMPILQAGAAVRDELRKILADADLLKALDFCRPCGAEALQPTADEALAHIKADFLEDLALGRFKDGIHKDYAQDADRQCIRSCNKAYLDKGGDIIDSLKLIKNEKLRSFICFASFQTGLEKQAYLFAANLPDPERQKGPDGKPKPWPGAFHPGYEKLVAQGLVPQHTFHVNDLTVTDGKAVLRCDNVTQLQSMQHDSAPVAATRYTLEIEVDLNQDTESKDFPVFTTRMTCAPVQMSCVAGWGDPAWPEGMRGTELAGRVEDALGEGAEPLLALVRQAVTRHADATQAKFTMRDPEQPDRKIVGPITPGLNLEILKNAPADCARLVPAMKAAFAPFKAQLDALAAEHRDAASPVSVAGYAALIHSIDGLAEALRSDPGAIYKAVDDDPAWSALHVAAASIASGEM